MLVGDLNIAPLEHDVWSHKQLLDVVSHTPVEVAAMQAWLRAGWHDAVRHFVPADQKLYTWWSYRNRDWRLSDRGRRLDHIWVTPDLAPALRSHRPEGRAGLAADLRPRPGLRDAGRVTRGRFAIDCAMDTLPATPLPDPASVYAAAALQERRFHALKSGDSFAIVDTLGDVVAAAGSNDGLYHRRHALPLAVQPAGRRRASAAAQLQRRRRTT